MAYQGCLIFAEKSNRASAQEKGPNFNCRFFFCFSGRDQDRTGDTRIFREQFYSSIWPIFPESHSQVSRTRLNQRRFKNQPGFAIGERIGRGGCRGERYGQSCFEMPRAVACLLKRSQCCDFFLKRRGNLCYDDGTCVIRRVK